MIAGSVALQDLLSVRDVVNQESSVAHAPASTRPMTSVLLWEHGKVTLQGSSARLALTSAMGVRCERWPRCDSVDDSATSVSLGLFVSTTSTTLPMC